MMPLLPHLPKPRQSHRGLTLLQLMMALAVLAVAFALAAPEFKALLDRQRADTTRHLLSSHFAAARMIAIQRNVRVSVCPTQNGLRCLEGADWSQGWMSYIERDGSVTALEVLRHQPWSPPAGWAVLSTHGRGVLRYQGNGRAYGSNLSMRICRGNHLHGRVIINNSGRIRSERHDAPGRCLD